MAVILKAINGKREKHAAAKSFYLFIYSYKGLTGVALKSDDNFIHSGTFL